MDRDTKEAIRRRCFILGYDDYFEDMLQIVEDLVDSAILFYDFDIIEKEQQIEDLQNERDDLLDAIKDLESKLDEIGSVL